MTRTAAIITVAFALALGAPAWAQTHSEAYKDTATPPAS